MVHAMMSDVYSRSYCHCGNDRFPKGWNLHRNLILIQRATIKFSRIRTQFSQMSTMRACAVDAGSKMYQFYKYAYRKILDVGTQGERGRSRVDSA